MRRTLFLVVFALGALAVLATPAMAHATIFTVRPSGGDDTQNIQRAFDRAVAAGSGSVVRLTEGHFYVDSIVVAGFDGAFEGAGKGRTTIDCLRGRDASLPGLVLLPDVTYYTFLFGFQGSDVRVADLRFDITPFSPAETWFDGTEYTQCLNEVFYLDGDTSAAFDRVSCKGHAGDYLGHNTDWSIFATGGTHGSGVVYTVSRCDFDTFDGLFEYGVAPRTITIGGTACRGNVFRGGGLGCFLVDTSSANVVISHNVFKSGGTAGVYAAAVSIDQGEGTAEGGPPTAPSRYLVAHNAMHVAPPADCVDLFDFGPAILDAGKLLDAVVAANTMVLSGSLDLPEQSNAAGVLGFYAQDVSVVRNRITGTGYAGIVLGSPLVGDDAPGSVSGWKIIGNDVRGVTAQTAPIYLGPGTTGCTVIGGPRPTYVRNEGSDNILCNVTLLPDPPAAAATSTRSLRHVKALGQVRPF